MSLAIWTVYERPSDYPTLFVARRFILDKPTAEILAAATLDELRAMLPPGLARMERNDSDDANIVEVWL